MFTETLVSRVVIANLGKTELLTSARQLPDRAAHNLYWLHWKIGD